jgi:GntR family transcriptional regulator, transcriptional repressor for pyruvate dehydrogenase complex
VPKTAELVAGTLRRMIVDGRLEDGDFLPHESELMAQFHVSRPTVREAVRVLESDTTGRGSAQLTNRCAGGLTRSRARRMAGWTAARIVRRNAGGRETRVAIEPAAATLLAENGTDDAHRELDRLVREIPDAWEAGDLARAHRHTYTAERQSRRETQRWA